MSKIRTVVCGTSFGRFYIEGIKSLNDQYELVGILSTGSRQSKRIAEKENIKLKDKIDDLKDELEESKDEISSLKSTINS